MQVFLYSLHYAQTSLKAWYFNFICYVKSTMIINVIKSKTFLCVHAFTDNDNYTHVPYSLGTSSNNWERLLKAVLD